MDTLAAAYAETGEFRQAVETLNQSLHLLKPAQEEMARRIRRRLQLYEAGKPYRDPPPAPARGN